MPILPLLQDSGISNAEKSLSYIYLLFLFKLGFLGGIKWETVPWDMKYSNYLSINDINTPSSLP
jgi:hypothetical protein